MFFAGIGSRAAPEEILNKMTKYASILERLGYKLRSGKAKGSDKAFEKGISNPKNKEIFTSGQAQPWAFDYVRKCMPNDRPAYDDPKGYVNWDPYIKGLLARNMQQILGINGDAPVDFVVCWTPPEDYATSKVGGTGYAIRCAQINNIPVYNLVFPDEVLALEEKIREILKNKLV